MLQSYGVTTRYLKNFLSVLALTSICLSAHASVPLSMSGMQLKEFANSENAWDQGLFYGYLDGMKDAYFDAMIKSAGTPLQQEFQRQFACVPEEVSKRQFAEVVKKYLNEHPERLHDGSTVLVTEAIESAWPC